MADPFAPFPYRLGHHPQGPDLSNQLMDGLGTLEMAGANRIIGIEVKARVDQGPTVELGMWVPQRELLIPWGGYHFFEFPCTVHTLRGDLNFQNAEVR